MERFEWVQLLSVLGCFPPTCAGEGRGLCAGPSVVAEHDRWTVYSSKVNLPAALNDPRLAKRESDFFTKTWGLDFAESEVLPSSLPSITREHFGPYLQETAQVSPSEGPGSQVFTLFRQTLHDLCACFIPLKCCFRGRESTNAVKPSAPSKRAWTPSPAQAPPTVINTHMSPFKANLLLLRPPPTAALLAPDKSRAELDKVPKVTPLRPTPPPSSAPPQPLPFSSSRSS